MVDKLAMSNLPETSTTTILNSHFIYGVYLHCLFTCPGVLFEPPRPGWASSTAVDLSQSNHCLSRSSNFWYFNFDISTQLELCLWSCQWFLGRWDGNVKRQINSSLENGMWVKEWRYLWYFISFIGGDDSRPQNVVQSGKSMLSGEWLLCTCYHTCKLRGCWWTMTASHVVVLVRM